MSSTGMPAPNHHQLNLHCSQLTSYLTVVCLMPLSGATGYTNRQATETFRETQITSQLFTCTNHMSGHFVMQIRAGGRACSVHTPDLPCTHQYGNTTGQTGSTHTHTHKQWHATDTCPIVCSLIFQHCNNCELLLTLYSVLYTVGRPFKHARVSLRTWRIGNHWTGFSPNLNAGEHQEKLTLQYLRLKYNEK
jgi:hypothetical protein